MIRESARGGLNDDIFASGRLDGGLSEVSCYASMLEIEIVLMLHISNNMTFKPPPYVSKLVLQSTVELR